MSKRNILSTQSCSSKPTLQNLLRMKTLCQLLNLSQNDSTKQRIADIIE